MPITNPVSQPRPADAVGVTIPASVTSVSLAAANPDRRQLIIENKSSKTLFVTYGATATLADYTFSLVGGASFESVLDGYTGVVSGIWPTANGSALVTEVE